MKRKQTRSAKTRTSAASARRPVTRPAAKPKAKTKVAPKAKAPKAARPAAKRKTATRTPAKKKAIRRAAPPRAARARKAAPASAPTVSVPAPTPAPQTLSAGFQELASPPTTLGGLVRKAQATQPLPSLPAEPAPVRPEPPQPKPQPLTIPPILLEGDERTQPVTPVPVEKFVLGPTPAPESAPAEPAELPATYGTGNLFLTARDPHCLYAHWDLSEAQQRRFSAFAHHLAVRVYLERASGEITAETSVEPGARHAFLQVSRAGASYVAQLGCYQPGGEWLALAVSEPTVTPPEAVAEDKTVRWATVSPMVPTPEAHAPQSEAFAPAEVPTVLMQPAPAPEPVFAAPPEPVPAAPQFQPLPTTAAHVPEPWRDGAPQVRPQPSGAGAQPAAVPPVWSAVQERILAEMVELAMGQPRTVGSVELVERAQRRKWREVSAPAAQPGASLPFNLPLPLGGPASLPVPMEAQPLGISSAPAGVPPSPARQFWFNLNVEVVVYGATEPNARVTLGGQPVRLRPDGTFSCRFSLPDGVFDLAAVAVSVDDDKRHADLSLGRRTEYHDEVGVHPQDKALKPPTPEHIQGAQAQ